MIVTITYKDLQTTIAGELFFPLLEELGLYFEIKGNEIIILDSLNDIDIRIG